MLSFLMEFTVRDFCFKIGPTAKRKVRGKASFATELIINIDFPSLSAIVFIIDVTYIVQSQARGFSCFYSKRGLFQKPWVNKGSLANGRQRRREMLNMSGLIWLQNSSQNKNSIVPDFKMKTPAKLYFSFFIFVSFFGYNLQKPFNFHYYRLVRNWIQPYLVACRHFLELSLVSHRI